MLAKPLTCQPDSVLGFLSPKQRGKSVRGAEAVDVTRFHTGLAQASGAGHAFIRQEHKSSGGALESFNANTKTLLAYIINYQLSNFADAAASIERAKNKVA